MTEFTPGSKHWLRARSGTYSRMRFVQDTVVKVTPKRVYWEISGPTDHEGKRGLNVRLATAEEVRHRLEQEAFARLEFIVSTRLNAIHADRNFDALIAMARAGGAEVPEWVLEVMP